MKAFRALLRVSLTALLKSISPGRAGAALAIGLMAGLSVLLSLLFGGVLVMAFAPLGMLGLVPGILCLLGAAMAFLLTAFGAGGVLFGGRDNDLLLALPISDSMLLAARLLAVYLENLLTFGLTILPGMLLYCAAAGSPAMLLPTLLVVPAANLIPTLLAALVGWAITWLASHSRHNALLANLGYGLVVLGCFALSIGINLFTRSSMLSEQGVADGLAGVLSGPLWLFGQMGAACTGSLPALLWTLALSVLPAALFLLLLGRSYRRLLTRMGARAARKQYRMTAQRSAGAMAALLRKEAARFFHTPIYLFNTGFGLILLLAATVAACWQKDFLLAWLGQEAGITLTGGQQFAAVAGCICFLLSTVSTSSVSLSLEGRSFWLLKSLPVSAAQILRAKVWFNLLAALPLTGCCVLALWVGFGFTPVQGISLLVCTAALTWFLSLFGMAANLLFPRLDAANDTVICKQSLSATVGVLGGMAVVGAGIGLCFALAPLLPAEGCLLAGAAVLALFALLLNRWLATAGVRRLAALG
ncbi:hypothetical protein [uncultured Gemmiger sp.]|uniref:putative ABC transporter permease subunit n=1 Tax=uncultured Gemmiger sp. TaxID=1623490 RepID=UPI0025D54E17|nr:hypothetical protein [uncultured Gemmiger sp.]